MFVCLFVYIIVEQWRSSGGAVEEQWRSSGGAEEEKWRSRGAAVSRGGAVEEQWRSSGGEKEDCINCELIGGGSLKILFIFIVAVYYTHQYMLCIVAIVGCTLHTSIHAMHCCYCWLYTTHINTCYALLLLLAVYYTHQYMLCIVAIVGCTTTYINTCYALLLLLLYTTHINTCYALLLLLAVHYTHINTCYALLLLLTVPIYTMLSKISEHTISCCYCWLHPVGSATSSFEDLVTLHRVHQIFW